MPWAREGDRVTAVAGQTHRFGRGPEGAGCVRGERRGAHHRPVFCDGSQAHSCELALGQFKLQIHASLGRCGVSQLFA